MQSENSLLKFDEPELIDASYVEFQSGTYSGNSRLKESVYLPTETFVNIEAAFEMHVEGYSGHGINVPSNTEWREVIDELRSLIIDLTHVRRVGDLPVILGFTKIEDENKAAMFPEEFSQRLAITLRSLMDWIDSKIVSGGGVSIIASKNASKHY